MKQNEPLGKNEPLGRTLQEWEVDAALPARFQEQVWQRIARSMVDRRATWWQGLWRSLEAAIHRPVLAGCCVAILLLAGLSAGIAQARQASARLDETLETRYLQSVDPYQAPRH